MKVVFMGTPDFAVPCLKTIIDMGHEVAAVVTQPDRAKGRGNKVIAPPVKILALEHGIKVYQPEKVKAPEVVEQLKEIAPDIIIAVAFGQLLSKQILELPAYGCINVHASLLPQYRGSAPINWCIINGEKTTGVTTMYMDQGLDTGDMILKKEIGIPEDWTAEQLYYSLSELGAQLLCDTLKLIEENKAPRTPQNKEEASYYPMLTKSLGKIDWNKDSSEIINLIRGTYPWPGCYSTYNGKVFKIFKARAFEKACGDKEPGTVVEVTKTGMVIACGKGCIEVIELQFENEKRMSVEAYLRGHNMDANTIVI